MQTIKRFFGSFGLLGVMLIFTGCNIGLYENYELGVPYRQQERSDYCVPASILMWRLYDGLSPVTQTTIYNYLGGHACSPHDVPDGVNHFTNAFDAYLDLTHAPNPTQMEELVARQITSEDRLTPVIAIVGNQRNHVGVINGGKYKKYASGAYYQWEFLYFHDPRPFGESSYYSSSSWLDFFCPPGAAYCGQIVSANAVSGWQTYYADYRSKISPYGGGYDCFASDGCGPYYY